MIFDRCILPLAILTNSARIDHKKSIVMYGFIMCKSKGSLVASCVELIGAISSLQIVNNLEDIARVLVLSFREADLFVSFDVVKQVVVNRLEGFIESFEMISSKLFSQLAYIIEVPISVGN